MLRTTIGIPTIATALVKTDSPLIQPMTVHP